MRKGAKKIKNNTTKNSEFKYETQSTQTKDVENRKRIERMGVEWRGEEEENAERKRRESEPAIQPICSVCLIVTSCRDGGREKVNPWREGGI